MCYDLDEKCWVRFNFLGLAKRDIDIRTHSLLSFNWCMRLSRTWECWQIVHNKKSVFQIDIWKRYILISHWQYGTNQSWEYCLRIPLLQKFQISLSLSTVLNVIWEIFCAMYWLVNIVHVEEFNVLRDRQYYLLL